MIKRNKVLLSRINAVTDMALVVLSFALSSWLWLIVMDNDRGNMALTGSALLLSGGYALALVLFLAVLGFYSTRRARRLVWKLETIFSAVTVVVLAASFLLFLTRLVDFSRGVLALFYGFTLIFLCGKYAILSWAAASLRTGGYNINHQLVIGTGPLAAQYKRNVEEERGLGIEIDRSLTPNDETALDEALASPDIDEAVIALEPEDFGRMKTVISLCDKNGVKYSVIPFYNDVIPAHPEIETIGSTKLISMRVNRLENVGWASLKRAFDFISALLGLIILSPLLIAVAIGVKASSPGPVLFRQKRTGYKRKEFQMLKFRSMRVNETENTAWTTDVDERRTAFGAFIRKFSLDELPQLWNVLKGDMSLVGPRPELPFFVEQFRETVPLYMVKHQVKPGITGWAQVNGYRGDTSIEKRIEYDLWYIDNWSPLLDLKILFKTVFGGMMNTEKRSAPAADKDVRIVVAAHKAYWMPKDKMYLPLQVGALGKPSLGFQRDDAGDHISGKNPHYCELTGLYWAWKNLDCDYLGLAHYRRHFTRRGDSPDRRDVLTLEQASQLLAKTDVLLPKKRHYWIETNYSQYAHAHHAADLDKTREIIAERCPEYLTAFDRSMKRTSGHKFNMFVMKRDLADAYCSWLFSILFELEKRLDISGYNPNDQRVFGFVAERLLDVWIDKNGITYKEIPYIFLEKQNWLVKGVNFVKRKMGKRTP